MSDTVRDLILGILLIIKNVFVLCLIGFLIIKTDNWWPLFLMFGLSSFKTTDNEEKSNES